MAEEITLTSASEKGKSKHILILSLAIAGVAAVIGTVLYLLSETPSSNCGACAEDCPNGSCPECQYCDNGTCVESPCSAGCINGTCPDDEVCANGICVSSGGAFTLYASDGGNLTIDLAITGGEDGGYVQIWFCPSETVTPSCSTITEVIINPNGSWTGTYGVASAGTYDVIAQNNGGGYSSWVSVDVTGTAQAISLSIGSSASGPWGDSLTIPQSGEAWFDATNDNNTFNLIINTSPNTGGCSSMPPGDCNGCTDGDTCIWDTLAADTPPWGEGGFPTGTYYLAAYDPTTGLTSNWVELIVQT